MSLIFLIDDFNVNVKQMKQLLSSKELDAQLNQKGFVVVPFLHKDEVEELKTFFEDNHKDEIPSFYATAHSANIDFRKKMNGHFSEVLLNEIKQAFENNEQVILFQNRRGFSPILECLQAYICLIFFASFLKSITAF